MLPLRSLFFAACLLPAMAAEAPTFSFADLPPRLQEDLCARVRAMAMLEDWTGFDPDNEPGRDGRGPFGGTLTVTEADVLGDSRRELIFRYQPPVIAGVGDDGSPWHAACYYPGHERMEERGYVCDADGLLLHAVPLFFFHGQRDGLTLRGERAQVFRPRGTHQELMYDVRWSMEPDRAEFTVKKGVSKPHSPAMESMQRVRARYEREEWLIHESPIEPEFYDITEEGLRERAERIGGTAPSLLDGAPTWSISLHELLTQASPRWRAAGESMPAERLREARAWTRADACRAFGDYIEGEGVEQPELEIVAISGSGYVVFDVRNTGGKPVAYVPLDTDTMWQYALHSDKSSRGMHSAALYGVAFAPVTTPPLLLAPGEGYRDADNFGMFPLSELRGLQRVWMEYCFGLDARNRLAREVKRPFPRTGAKREFWRERWAAVKDCLVPTMKSLPLTLPQGWMERQGLGEQVIELRTVVPEEGALRLRFVSNRPDDADFALPSPESPAVAACYSLLVVGAQGREWRWAASPGGTPQPTLSGDAAKAAAFWQWRELLVLPPTPEARAALEEPVTLYLCYEPEEEGEYLASAPFYLLPAYFRRQLPAPKTYWDVAQKLEEGERLPPRAEERRPELRLVSLDAQGRAFCCVENVMGEAPLALPRAGCEKAAPAYRLHLWDALGRETQLPALCIALGMPLGQYAAWQCIPAGESAGVAIDFPPLTPQQRRRTRRMAVSYDPARCEGPGRELPAAREGETAPILAPALVSDQRPLPPGGWEDFARRRELNDLRLTLLSLDLDTGEAQCDISNGKYGDEHAYFVPGMSWGDDCFTLTVQDAQGREYRWRVQRGGYDRNFPKVRELKAGEGAAERIDFGFDDVAAPTEEQAAFLAALRSPGAVLRLDYGMTQALFLSAHSFTDGRDAEAVECFEEMHRKMVRGMRSGWLAVEEISP